MRAPWLTNGFLRLLKLNFICWELPSEEATQRVPLPISAVTKIRASLVPGIPLEAKHDAAGPPSETIASIKWRCWPSTTPDEH
jgi:hypothetical protein